MNEDQIFRSLDNIRDCLRALIASVEEVVDIQDQRLLDAKHALDTLDQVLYSEPHENPHIPNRR